MRRITIAIVSTIAVLVLLFSYRTSTGGTGGAVNPAAPPGVVRAAPGTPAPATSGTPTASGASSSSGSSGSTDVTVNGTAQDNGYGTVQVRARIRQGRITDVTTLSLPGDGHSQRINSFAVPQLRQEVIAAQSANVDTVSGATATSDAYRTSLQAALDAAHFRPGS